MKPIVQIEPKDSGWEVTAYRQQHPERFWVHAIAHGGASVRSSQLLLQLPEGIEIARATLWTDSGEQEAQMDSGGQPFTCIFAGRCPLLHCEAVYPMTTFVPS